MIIPPLEFEPRLLHTLWGGKRLYGLKGIPAKNLTIGESWEVSPMAEIPSIVRGGELSGISLPQVMQRFGQEIMGEALCEKYGKKFPLLIKFIDAAEDLSVQVHPGKMEEGEEAKRLSNTKNAKNEIWYIMDATPEAEVIYGLSQDTTPHELINYAIEGNLFELLRKIPVEAGEVYDNPAGTIHAIRKGNLILEIQQPIDVTYRLWDYDRIDAESGNKRPLHLTEAVDTAILKRCTKRNVPYRAIPNSATLILEKEFATIEMVWVSQQKFDYEPPFSESFAVLVGLSGESIVSTNQGIEMNIRRGKTVLFPASGMPLKISSNSDGHMLAISLPSPTPLV